MRSDEFFALLVAGKMSRYKAYAIAVARNGKPENYRALASDLWRGKGLTSLNIRRRLNELMIERRKSADLRVSRID